MRARRRIFRSAYRSARRCHRPPAPRSRCRFAASGAARLAFIGDGGTSQGAFYEAINLAGAKSLPLVCVIVNNRYAISVPVTQQTAAQTLAQKAIAAGIPAVQIDGNDVLIVRQVVSEAVERARAGGGPSVIEALSYRLGDHTTSDDATRYRSRDEVETGLAARTDRTTA